MFLKGISYKAALYLIKNTLKNEYCEKNG